jgi:3-phenylpropionate/trans-cinnamate dioxygenase ferredoxin reductase subunit
MNRPRVIIIGAGHAGFQAASSLRQLGFHGELMLIAGEHGLPYQRPPLSKELLNGETTSDKLAFRPLPYYAKHAIELVSGDPVLGIDREASRVELSSGRSISYSDLVIATGARSRTLPTPGSELDGVVTLRTLEDAVIVNRRLDRGPRLVVIGGGFIGLEVAAAGRQRGLQVTVLEALKRTLARIVSPTISKHICNLHRAHGTEVRHGIDVRRLVTDGGRQVAAVELANGELIRADTVVVGIGAVPNTELAVAAGLECADGVVVDEYLRSADPHIWAIGDCAAFPDRDGCRRRLESVQNATDHGRAVAATITGQPHAYDATPWFWTCQHDCRLQIAGLTTGHDTAVVRGDPDSGSFSVFCFDGDRFLGAESVNRPRDHLAARKLLDARVPLSPAQAGDESYDLKLSAEAART